ncbi:hypothetical protein MKX03_036534, partial [Papaver bracteatum]
FIKEYSKVVQMSLDPIKYNFRITSWVMSTSLWRIVRAIGNDHGSSGLIPRGEDC